MEERKKYLRLIGSLLIITLGAAINAFSLQSFNVPAKLSGGGVNGITLLLHYIFGTPIGLMTFVLNIPLFILGWREVNSKFIIKTFYGVVIYSLFLDLFKGIHLISVNDILLSALYAGVISGLGSGIVFRAGGSLGGTDIVAKVVQRKMGWSMGTTSLVLSTIILLASWLFLGPTVVLYTLVAMYTYGRTVDLIQSGVPVKAVTIISDQSEKMVKRIMEELGRGATFIHGEGAYSLAEKNIIMCVVYLQELARLKQVVRDVDQNAFMIVQNAGEVVGKGFVKMENEA